ncbi:MAG: helix-turn-helix domain-containing protein [Pseudomonadota bacterium]
MTKDVRLESRWKSELHWRRTGQQNRSERTQSALLDAAEELILEKGTDATSIADIAKRAGSSVGAVYHHFKDKTALYYAVFHRMTATYESLNKQASDPRIWEGATIRDLFRGYLEIVLTTTRENGAAKAAASAVIADFPELNAHYCEIQGETRKALLALVMERRGEIGAPDAENAAAFAIDQLSAMLRVYMDANIRPAALAPLDEDRFVAQSVELVARYLELPPA